MIIAIDGHSSSGKSTLAKDLARYLEYIYIDSGAMYRAVTRFVIDQNIAIADTSKIIEKLPNIEITIKHLDGKNIVFLNDEDVTQTLRVPEITNLVSEVAMIKEVREKLVDIQRAQSLSSNVVMDGRDIGSVVFPNADLKLFVTANEDVRAKRRFEELKARNIEVAYDEVLNNLLHRDKIDSNRSVSPLVKTEDAILLDNSYLNREEQLQLVLKYLSSSIHK